MGSSGEAAPLGDRPSVCPVCNTPVDDSPRAAAVSEQGPCPRCGHLLWFESQCVEGVTVIRLVDNRVAVVELLELLDNAVEDGTSLHILINFGAIQQVSSAALGKLVKLLAKAEGVRGKLKLCGLHPDLRQVFRITRIDQYFETYDDEETALASFRTSARTGD